MKRQSPLAPARRKVRPKVPDAVRQAVKARQHGVCALCAHRLGLDFTLSPSATAIIARRRGARRIAQLHHWFPVRTWPELATDSANVVGLCAECHDEHERAHRRIPRALLPPDTLALAAGDGPRTNYLERTYPLADAGRHPAAWEAP